MKYLSHWALVLAGGDGTRLQGLTRAIAGRAIPKQYCRILGDRSMLQATLSRIEPIIPSERTAAIVNLDHLAIALPQLERLPPGNLVVQPRNRDTGPGILLSLLALEERLSDGIVAVFPSDHFVADAKRFRGYVGAAFEMVRCDPDRIVLLGIRPDSIEPGYGYIEPAQPIRDDGEIAAFRVAGFCEKPSVEATLDLVRRGGLWSCFVMVFRLRRMLDVLAALRSDDYARMSDRRRCWQELARLYDELTPWNFSHDVLARIARELVVIRAEGTGWSDLGTPEGIERTLAQLDVTPPWHPLAMTYPARSVSPRLRRAL
jgi:mannose-1-phosphate guanylyltransferase